MAEAIKYKVHQCTSVATRVSDRPLAKGLPPCLPAAWCSGSLFPPGTYAQKENVMLPAAADSSPGLFLTLSTGLLRLHTTVVYCPLPSHHLLLSVFLFLPSPPSI